MLLECQIHKDQHIKQIDFQPKVAKSVSLKCKSTPVLPQMTSPS